MRGPLISAPELRASLNQVALFDVRWSLANPDAGRDDYRAGHIPTAVFVDLEADLCGEGPGRHPLPSATRFATTLGLLGVGSHTDVVVYDDVSGSVAARMWWMIRAIGHRGTVRVLDGGVQAWTEAGFDIESGEVAAAPVHYPTPPRDFRDVVTTDELAELMLKGSGRRPLLIDGRAPERYRGEHEPVDPKAGHIPGAVNLPWQATVAADGGFADAGALRQRFVDLGAETRPVIVACGSGVTSCHLALAMHIAGFPRPRVYIGSFSAWADTDLPVNQGPDPG